MWAGSTPVGGSKLQGETSIYPAFSSKSILPEDAAVFGQTQSDR
jgi:hypothetical protein